jgi:hypothetical protein
MTVDLAVEFLISDGGEPVGSIRCGARGPLPVHSSTCQFCGVVTTEDDYVEYDEVVWDLEDHLQVCHGVRTRRAAA